MCFLVNSSQVVTVWLEEDDLVSLCFSDWCLAWRESSVRSGQVRAGTELISLETSALRSLQSLSWYWWTSLWHQGIEGGDRDRRTLCRCWYDILASSQFVCYQIIGMKQLDWGRRRGGEWSSYWPGGNSKQRAVSAVQYSHSHRPWAWRMLQQARPLHNIKSYSRTFNCSLVEPTEQRGCGWNSVMDALMDCFERSSWPCSRWRRELL